MNEIEALKAEITTLKSKNSKSTNELIKLKQLESKLIQLENKANNSSATGVFVNNNMVKDIAISKIRPNPYQPRKLFDSQTIETLAESISEEGLIQPIIVIEEKDGYVLIAGERRLRACQSLGEEYIKAIIDTKATLNDLKIKAITENLAREDLCLADEAIAINSLQSTGLSYSKIAQKVGKNKTYVSRMLNIAKLNSQCLDYIRENKMSQSASLEYISLSTIEDDKKINFIKLLNEKQISQLKLQDLLENQKENIQSTKELIKIDSNINGIKVFPIKQNSKKINIEIDIAQIDKLSEEQILLLLQNIKNSLH